VELIEAPPARPRRRPARQRRRCEAVCDVPGSPRLGLGNRCPVDWFGYALVIRIARQPKWIALLLFALVLAAVFAWLGKWQVERAVLDSQAASASTEIPKPLTALAQPGVLFRVLPEGI
jgi:hypothetical protein